MAMPFEVYTDHYALQWLKTMRTGSTFLHRWSAALEEYDFTVKHRPEKAQTGGCPLTPHLQKMFYKSTSWKMRTRLGISQ